MVTIVDEGQLEPSDLLIEFELLHNHSIDNLVINTVLNGKDQLINVIIGAIYHNRSHYLDSLHWSKVAMKFNLLKRQRVFL